MRKGKFVSSPCIRVIAFFFVECLKYIIIAVVFFRHIKETTAFTKSCSMFGQCNIIGSKIQNCHTPGKEPEVLQSETTRNLVREHCEFLFEGKCSLNITKLLVDTFE